MVPSEDDGGIPGDVMKAAIGDGPGTTGSGGDRLFAPTPGAAAMAGAIDKLADALKASIAMDGSPAFVAVSLGDLQRAGKFADLPLGAEDTTVIAIQWQCGPLREVGVNGCSIEDVIDVLMARLKGFQAGPFACGEDMNALTALDAAKRWLLARTAVRQAQGVEGTNQPHQAP